MDSIIIQVVVGDGTNAKIHEVQVPKAVLLRDFLMGLKEAYSLRMDLTQTESIFVRTENPVGFLKGNKPIEAYGLRTASKIFVW